MNINKINPATLKITDMCIVGSVPGCPVVAALREHLPTWAAILGSAALTFAVSALVSALGRKIPRVGKLVFG